MLDNPDVEYVEPVQYFYTNAIQSGATWGLDRVDQAPLPLDSTYTYFTDASDVHAYVIDTGINSRHVDFSGRIGNGIATVGSGDDCNGHGTHVAGTIGGTTYGLAKNITLHGVKVFGCEGGTTTDAIVQGINWVANNAQFPAVANMSLGGGVSTALDSATDNLINRGVVTVVAAGNDNANACNYSPARTPNAITVASSTRNDGRSSFSNYGSCVDIFAPGSSITAPWFDSATSVKTISGTSMASPHVAGAAALYLSENPSATPAQVAAALTSNATVGAISNVTGAPNKLLNVSFIGGDPVDPVTPILLDQAVAVSLEAGSDKHYSIDLNFGTYVFETSGGFGDVDLYVKQGSKASSAQFDCSSSVSGNVESCSLKGTGTYFINLVADTAVSGASLTVTKDTNTTDPICDVSDPNAGNYPAWSASTVYTSSETVSYNNLVWQAKWWNQSSAPAADGGPWALLSAAELPWEAGTVYNSGDEVNHNGRRYSARWWNRGSEPGVDSVWRDIGEASCQ